MSLGKKDIIKNIESEALISQLESRLILDEFLSLIKSKSKKSLIKISGFGNFALKTTPERVGRNPKNLKEYIIPQQKKLYFYLSNKIKSRIN